VSACGQLQVHEYRIASNQLVLRHKDKLGESVADAVAWHTARESFVYIGYRSGVVCRWSATQRQLVEVIQLENGIRKLLPSRRQLRLVVITDQLQLCQFSLAGEEVAEISKIKLPALGRITNVQNRSSLSDRNQSVNSRNLSAILVDEPNGILALCVFGERLVRLFQLDSGQNLAVLVVESADFHWAGVSALSFCVESDLLVAGTSNNHVVIWQREYDSSSKDRHRNDLNGKRQTLTLKRLLFNSTSCFVDEQQIAFVKVGELKIKGAVNSLAINAQSKIAFTSNQQEISFVEKQVLKSAYTDTLIAIQVSHLFQKCLTATTNAMFVLLD
jgi:WD40 repeat protein